MRDGERERKRESKGKRGIEGEREDGENAHAEGREEGHTWRVRHDTVGGERETPRTAGVRGTEKRITSERRGCGGEGEDARGGTYTVAS